MIHLFQEGSTIVKPLMSKESHTTWSICYTVYTWFPPNPKCLQHFQHLSQSICFSILILLVHARMWCQIWRFRSLRSFQGQAPWCRFPWRPWDWRMITLYSETLHKSHQAQEFNRLNLTTANAVKWFCELLGVQRLECATECLLQRRLAKPKLNVPLPGSTGICKKKRGWFNQQTGCQYGKKNRLPATWPNQSQSYQIEAFQKQDSPPKNLWSQGQPARSMHPLSAMSWALLLCTRMGPLLADSQAN